DREVHRVVLGLGAGFGALGVPGGLRAARERNHREPGEHDEEETWAQPHDRPGAYGAAWLCVQRWAMSAGVGPSRISSRGQTAPPVGTPSEVTNLPCQWYRQRENAPTPGVPSFCAPSWPPPQGPSRC